MIFSTEILPGNSFSPENLWQYAYLMQNLQLQNVLYFNFLCSDILLSLSSHFVIELKVFMNFNTSTFTPITIKHSKYGSFLILWKLMTYWQLYGQLIFRNITLLSESLWILPISLSSQPCTITPAFYNHHGVCKS